MKHHLAKILLVEDDKNLGYILKDFLELSKYTVRWGENGTEGINLYNNESFDLCLLDIMMPFKDGFTLAEEIRKKMPRYPLYF